MTVTLDAPSSLTVTVDYTTVGGTATAGSDTQLHAQRGVRAAGHDELCHE
jgi:hypothetical protein